MSVLAGAAPAVSRFAGVSAVAVGLTGMLMPGPRQLVTPVDIACARAAGMSVAGLSAQGSQPPGAEYTLCLSVLQTAGQPTPGGILTYSINVWLASLPEPGNASRQPAAVPVTVTLQSGSGAMQFTVCPDPLSPTACAVPPMLPGPPGSPLQAELAIPATAASGQSLSFTVSAADSLATVTDVLPASEPGTLIVVTPTPTPTPTPSSASQTPTPTPSSASSASQTPTPTPTRTPSPSHSDTPSPSRSPSPSHTPSPSRSASSRPGVTTTSSTGGTGTTGAGPISQVGATLPPGFAPPAAAVAAASLGDLPAPLPGVSAPAVSFPKVSPDPSLAPSPLALPEPQNARMANASAILPLDGRLIGIQVAGLAVLAAAVTIAVARLSLRRRATPRHGKP